MAKRAPKLEQPRDIDYLSSKDPKTNDDQQPQVRKGSNSQKLLKEGIPCQKDDALEQTIEFPPLKPEQAFRDKNIGSGFT